MSREFCESSLGFFHFHCYLFNCYKYPSWMIGFCCYIFSVVSSTPVEVFNDTTLGISEATLGFRTEQHVYHVITMGMSRDDADIWCQDNLNGSLAYPETETQYNVSKLQYKLQK